MAKETFAVKSDTNENNVENLIVNIKDTTVKESYYDPDAFLAPYNPDDIYNKTGDYSIYNAMYNDDQCFVSLQLKKDLVLSSGFDFMATEDQQEMKEFLENEFSSNMRVPFSEQLESILTAYENGVSFTEKKFKHTDGGMLTLDILRTRFPDTFIIETDKYGNITEFLQRDSDGDIKINPNAIIHYVNNCRYANPYGRSDYRAAYTAWFVKQEIIKYYAVFLEKHGTPTAIGRYDKNAPVAAVDDLFTALKKLQNSTALVIPKEIETELMESSSNGEAFTKGINIFNMFIGRALLIPDLMGFQGEQTGGGSYSLGTEQMNIFYKHIQRRREYLEAVVNHEIIRPIIIYNWGFQDEYPTFKFRPIKEDDAKEFAKIWIDAVKGNMWKPTGEEINHLQSVLQFPVTDEVEFSKPPVQFDPTGNPVDPSNPMGEDNDKDEAKKPINDKEAEDKEDEGDEETKSFAAEPENLLVQIENEPVYDSKVDFARLEKQLDNNLDKAISMTGPIIEGIYRDLIDQIERKRIVDRKDIEAVGKLKLKNLKQFKQVIKEVLRDNYTDAKQDAFVEILNLQQYAQGQLPSDAFLLLLEDEVFEYVGDWAYDVTKGARVEIINGIKNGASFSEISEGLRIAGEKKSKVSVERYVRTKLTETMNRARFDFFNESGIVHGYQFSAIMDGRTTPICSGLHGKKFRIGEDGTPIDIIPHPPLHFNCRSVLVPITTFEDFEADTTVKSKRKQDDGTFEDVTLSMKDFMKEEQHKGFEVFNKDD